MTKRKKFVPAFFNHMKDHPSFVTSSSDNVVCTCQCREEEWLVGNDPFYLKLGSNWPPCSKIADFQSIFARSASAVKKRKKFS